MFAVIFYKDGSSSENIFPKNGKAFEKFELASKDKNIAFVKIYGA